MRDQTPDQSKNQLQISIMNVRITCKKNMFVYWSVEFSNKPLIFLGYQTLVLEGKINIKFHTSKIESNAHMRQISDTSNLTMTYTQK